MAEHCKSSDTTTLIIRLDHFQTHHLRKQSADLLITPKQEVYSSIKHILLVQLQESLQLTSIFIIS